MTIELGRAMRILRQIEPCISLYISGNVAGSFWRVTAQCEKDGKVLEHSVEWPCERPLYHKPVIEAFKSFAAECRDYVPEPEEEPNETSD